MTKRQNMSPPNFVDADTLQAKTRKCAGQKDLSAEQRRGEVLQCLRTAIDEGHEAAKSYLVSTDPFGPENLGINAAKGLSRLMDAILTSAYTYTTEFAYPQLNPTPSESLCVVAVGGYGRQTMAPFSDVDLLFLLPYKQTAWGEQVIETLLYLLWDLGLKVGHATRSVEDCISHARRDVTIRTTLLESRYLVGEHKLYTDLRKRFWSDVAKSPSADFIDAKLSEREARHDRTGGSRYSVEPNLKDGKGGLRDLHTLMWIGKFVYRVETVRALVKHELLTDDEFELFEQAEAFLWEVRCGLHYIAGRAEEKLSFDRQVDLAERFGFRDDEEMRGVERFMKRYFRVAKDVGDLTRYILAALETQHKKSRPSIREIFGLSRRPARFPEAFIMDGGRMNVASDEVFQSDPINLLRLFQLSDKEELLIHPNALKLAARSVELIDDGLRSNNEANQLFLDVLASPRDPERVLRRMNETGVLGAFIPDFGRVVAMMQFNMYHHYTVDEHLLRAIGNLSLVERGELKSEHPLAYRLFKTLQNRRVLYLAVLLHDIAKGRKGDHSDLGAEIARTLAPRLGFSRSETETVAWLVQEHLVMSATAQSRDLADPQTIADFVSVVQTRERLKLLVILTVVDIRAVGPGVWNGWKGELLRTLYYEAESVLAGGHTTEPSLKRVDIRRQALANALDDWPAIAREQAIRRMPKAYWLGVDARQHLPHANLMRTADEAEERIAISFETDAFRSVTVLTIYAEDRPGLFGLLAGAITSVGASVQDAKAFTTTDGRILDIFWFQDVNGEPFNEPDRLKRLEDRVLSVVRGEFDPETAIVAERMGRRQQVFEVEPEVVVDNHASETFTIVEVSARRRRGLISAMSRAVSGRHLKISSAHIATFGEKIVGVFYVKNNFGLKLEQPAHIRQLKADIIDAASASDADELATI